VRLCCMVHWATLNTVTSRCPSNDLLRRLATQWKPGWTRAVFLLLGFIMLIVSSLYCILQHDL
jgi:hypothetical protein